MFPAALALYGSTMLKTSRKEQNPLGPVDADMRPRGRCYQSARTKGALCYVPRIERHGKNLILPSLQTPVLSAFGALGVDWNSPMVTGPR